MRWTILFRRFAHVQGLSVPKKDASLRVWLMCAVQMEKQPCLLCERQYRTRAELLRHIDEEHGGLQRYRNTFPVPGAVVSSRGGRLRGFCVFSCFFDCFVLIRCFAERI